MFEQSNNSNAKIDHGPVDWSIYATNDPNGTQTYGYYNDEEDLLKTDEEEDPIFDDMQLFFHSIGEPQFIPKFIEQKVSLELLLGFEEQDLIGCGVELIGDRKKILNHIREYHSERWVPTSLHDVTAKSMLTSPGYFILINDINKHFAYIGTTFAYLDKKLEMDPMLMSYGKDYVGIKKVASEVDELLATEQRMMNSFRKLRSRIYSHLDDRLLQPAHLIDERFVKRTRFLLTAYRTSVIAIAALIFYKTARILAAKLPW